MRGHPGTVRTSFVVERDDCGAIETIAGERHAWNFRPHFHAGDELVHVIEGRARLHLPNGCREIGAGERLRIPAGVVHRFEPIDREGWAFSSRFVPVPHCTTHAMQTLATRATLQLTQRVSLRTDVASLARTCAVSEGHLSRAFRRETGTGLHNFHVLLALHRAKALMRGQVPVLEAALAAGFYDQAHLNREFVRTYGMTPTIFCHGWDAA
jgi:AraC-like DNA-binding protein